MTESIPVPNTYLHLPVVYPGLGPSRDGSHWQAHWHLADRTVWILLQAWQLEPTLKHRDLPPLLSESMAVVVQLASLLHCWAGLCCRASTSPLIADDANPKDWVPEEIWFVWETSKRRKPFNHQAHAPLEAAVLSRTAKQSK
jgi:hypothetical protein